jgi:predicted nucleic acid-binding protein
LSAVIDASIVIAALSPDEASDHALDRIAPFMQGGGHAPALWPFEIANVFLFKHRRKSISLEAALDAWRVAMKFPMGTSIFRRFPQFRAGFVA